MTNIARLKFNNLYNRTPVSVSTSAELQCCWSVRSGSAAAFHMVTNETIVSSSRIIIYGQMKVCVIFVCLAIQLAIMLNRNLISYFFIDLFFRAFNQMSNSTEV